MAFNVTVGIGLALLLAAMSVGVGAVLTGGDGFLVARICWFIAAADIIGFAGWLLLRQKNLPKGWQVLLTIGLLAVTVGGLDGALGWTNYRQVQAGPAISLNIAHVAAGRMIAGQSQGIQGATSVYAVTAYLEATNTGAAGTIQPSSWAIHVKFPDGRVLDGMAVQIPPEGITGCFRIKNEGYRIEKADEFTGKLLKISRRTGMSKALYCSRSHRIRHSRHFPMTRKSWSMPLIRTDTLSLRRGSLVISSTAAKEGSCRGIRSPIPLQAAISRSLTSSRLEPCSASSPRSKRAC